MRVHVHVHVCVAERILARHVSTDFTPHSVALASLRQSYRRTGEFGGSHELHAYASLVAIRLATVLRSRVDGFGLAFTFCTKIACRLKQ